MSRTNRTTPAHESVNESGAEPVNASRKRKSSMVLPLISTAHDPHIYFKVLGPIVIADMPKFAKSDDGTVPIMHVVNLDTGEEGQLILPTVALSAFQRLGDDAIGRRFELQVGEKVKGKDYRAVELFELDE